MQDEVLTNKMGVEPIRKLLLKMGLPLVVSMMLQAVYNIVDSYFVSCMKDTAEITGMGEYGVNALTLAFPIQMLMVAVGVGTGVGINALLAKSLGEGNRKKASNIAGNALVIGIVTYIVFLLFGIFGVDVYIQSQTNDMIVTGMCHSYLKICLLVSVGITMYTIYEKILQATGRTVYAMVSQIAGALTNIILDPIMIFGYLGCPEMGIEGAALATVIGQMVSLVFTMVFHYGFNRDIDNGIKYLVPDKKIIAEIYKIGVPAIIMQALMSFMTYGVNIIFRDVPGAVTAYGVYYKIQQFIFFAAFGLNNAIIPIVSFNYGMRDKKRVTDGIKYGIIYTLVIMGIGLIGLEVLAEPLAGIFSLSPGTESMCILAIRICALGYLFAGANIAYQGIYQAFGFGVKSLVLSLIRLLVVALPLAWLFTKTSMADVLIWTAFPIAEGVALIVGIALMARINKTTISKLQEHVETMAAKERSKA